MGAAIQTYNLGKSYQINTGGSADLSLRELLEHVIHRKDTRRSRSEVETIWSLRGLDVTIDHGERIGLIGPNGSGKSTFLKLLSRVIAPSEGRLRLEGRLASLLEVGTGFHPELTGRENVFLNGTMLGMSRQTIRELFDEIVDFSGVGDFLDTPVKRYSSGMYTRLAFAVAAHVQTDILLVDEVLAVGDAAFQQKCLAKMEDVARLGRTVVLVSHNMTAIESLCSRVLMMDKGRLARDTDDVGDAISDYLSESGAGPSWSWQADEADGGPGSGDFRPVAFVVRDAEGAVVDRAITHSAGVRVEIAFDVQATGLPVDVGYVLYGGDGKPVLSSFSMDEANAPGPFFKTGRHRLASVIPAGMLNAGAYRLELVARRPGEGWLIAPGHDAPRIDLVVEEAAGMEAGWTVHRPGALSPGYPWFDAAGET